MPNWFYYDSNGQKQGPYTGGQIKDLAKNGSIVPDTIIENEEGKSAPAKKARGLMFADNPPIEPRNDEPSDESTATVVLLPPPVPEPLESDPYLTYRVEYGRNAIIHYLWQNLNSDTERILKDIGRGDDVNAKDILNKTPLHVAVIIGNIEIIRFLVSQGADVNAKDTVGNTPLHVAVEKGKNIEVAKFLVFQGANIKAKNVFDETPFDMAKAGDNIVVAEYLSSL